MAERGVATSEFHRPGIGILASGDGTNTEALIHASQSGILDAEVRVVISNNSAAFVLERVARLNSVYGLDIRPLHMSNKTHPRGFSGDSGEQTLEVSEAICKEFSAEGITVVALLGYNKNIRKEGDLFAEYAFQPHFRSYMQARMVNAHRGPLPLTRGLHGQAIEQKILDSELKFSETSFHVVAADYDGGPVVATHAFPISPAPLETLDTLRQTAKNIETRYIPHDMQRFIQEHLRWGRQSERQSTAVRLEPDGEGGYTHTPPAST